MTTALRPAARRDPAPAAACSPILMVDDHPPNLLALEAVLSPLGQPFQQATSGAAALRLLEKEDFAVALLDVRMPGLSGLDVAARLRDRGVQTPIIFISAAQEDSSVKADGYDRGAVDFIIKPFDPHVLRAKVRTFVQLHAQRRELERLSASYDAQRLIARQRVQTLARLSSQLSRRLGREELAQLVIGEAHDALSASASAAYLLAEDGQVLTLAASRADEPEWLPRQPLTLDAPLPLGDALHTGEAIWLESRQALLRTCPHLDAPRAAEALVVLPLRARDRPIGAVVLGFEEPRPWDTATQEFLLTLAAQFTAALERERLLGLERKQHHELQQRTEAMRFLADLSTLLSSSLDGQTVLRRLAHGVVPFIADWCAVDVLDADGGIQRLCAFHTDPGKLALAVELGRRHPVDPLAPRGVPNVLRTGETEWMAEVPASSLKAAARDDEHLAIIRRLGLASYVMVPIKARGRILGALSLVYAESERRYSTEDVRFIEEIAGRAALSVDNARLFQEQVEARRRLERRSKQALLLGDVGHALTRSDNLRDALQRCTEAIVSRLDAAFARIWTLDARAQVLELRASAGIYTHLDGPHGRVPLGRFNIGRIAREGTPHLTNDVPHDPHVSDPGWARREGMVAFAGYPVIIEGKVVGVLALFARQPLEDDTLTALSSIADAVAVGIERSRAEQLAREERDTLEVVNEVSRALAAELDREKLVQAVTDFGTKLSGAAFGAFFYKVADTPDDASTQYAISGVPREAFSRFPLPRNTQVFAPTFAGHGIVRVDDIRSDRRYGHNAPYHGMPEGHPPVASYLAVPVVSSSGRVIGGLFFGHPQPGVFTERTQRLVSGVAAQAAIALDNARSFREARRLIAELDRSNEALDQLAHLASHDLKAPLRGIAALSERLEEDLGDAVPPEAKRQLDLLRNRVQSMERLINGTLDFSRAGRVRTKPERVAVEQLLAEVIELSAAPEHAQVEVQPGMPELRTERVALQQVFMNLIGNALKHAKRADPHVRVGVSDAGAFFQFTVNDNGPGIAPEFHERIWGIFQTIEPRDTVEGTGLGLSIVKKLVESQGGRAWVESREGAGATFGFTWPKTETEAVTSA